VDRESEELTPTLKLKRRSSTRVLDDIDPLRR